MSVPLDRWGTREEGSVEAGRGGGRRRPRSVSPAAGVAISFPEVEISLDEVTIYFGEFFGIRSRP